MQACSYPTALIAGGQRLQRRRQQAAAAHAHIGGAGALGPVVNGQLLRVVAASGIGGAGREEVGVSGPKGVVGGPAGDSLYLEFPSRAEQDSQPPEDPPLIRVRCRVLLLRSPAACTQQTGCAEDGACPTSCLTVSECWLPPVFSRWHRQLCSPPQNAAQHDLLTRDVTQLFNSNHLRVSTFAACCCRLSVHYRVHSRQMLCIGGSQIPFGWSFLSIAKVPMQWSEGDIWSTEVRGSCDSQVSLAPR